MESIIQGLRDCDCDDKCINEFKRVLQRGDKQKAISILAEHREVLLERFHKCDSCISCLDYLVNQMEKEDGE